MTERDPYDVTGDEDLERLLRLAGRREPPPEEVTGRVRERVRDRWAREVARRRWRRRAVILSLAATVVLAAGGVLLRDAWKPGTAVEVGRVASLEGASRLERRGEGASTLQAHAVIASGDEVSTAADGRLALRLGSGRSLRLDRDSRIVIVSAAEVRLLAGALYVDSGREASGDGVEVRTDRGVVREVGTQFEVRLAEGGLSVCVREGKAVVESAGGTHEVLAGVRLALHADGTVDRQPAPPYGPGWDWVATVTPVPDVEGWTAEAFLDWFARERGLQLEFAGEAVARAAREAVISGSLEGLDAAQALDVVLPTCGLTYRTEGGTLQVDAAG